MSFSISKIEVSHPKGNFTSTFESFTSAFESFTLAFESFTLAFESFTLAFESFTLAFESFTLARVISTLEVFSGLEGLKDHIGGQSLPDFPAVHCGYPARHPEKPCGIKDFWQTHPAWITPDIPPGVRLSRLLVKNMKRIAMAIVVGGIVYAACWALASYMLPKKAPHTWFRIQTELGRLEDGAASYSLAHGTPPDAAELNKEIANAWIDKESWIDSVSPDLDENIVDILFSVSQTQIELRKFDQAPMYIVDSNLPNGCGFFWTGEDRTTATSGRDPDDINSWDKSSDEFYYERFHRRTSLRNLVVAMPPALIAAWIAGRKKKRPTRRDTATATSRPVSNVTRNMNLHSRLDARSRW